LIWPTARKWPSICLEAGYSEHSEEYSDLLADADLLLEGTNGGVALVKVTPLRAGETAIKNPFLEVWGFDATKGKKVQRVRQMV
jgi:hypothetical protein